jgi:hypothetical protein
MPVTLQRDDRCSECAERDRAVPIEVLTPEGWKATHRGARDGHREPGRALEVPKQNAMSKS